MKDCASMSVRELKTYCERLQNDLATEQGLLRVRMTSGYTSEVNEAKKVCSKLQDELTIAQWFLRNRMMFENTND